VKSGLFRQFLRFPSERNARVARVIRQGGVRAATGYARQDQRFIDRFRTHGRQSLAGADPRIKSRTNLRRSAAQERNRGEIPEFRTPRAPGEPGGGDREAAQELRNAWSLGRAKPDLRRGARWGRYGRNVAGKTTLLKCFQRAFRPTRAKFAWVAVSAWAISPRAIVGCCWT